MPRLLITTVSLATLLITAAPRGQANQELTQNTATETVLAARLNNPRGLETARSRRWLCSWTVSLTRRTRTEIAAGLLVAPGESPSTPGEACT